jgi:ornithine carbamoyltransferase
MTVSAESGIQHLRQVSDLTADRFAALLDLAAVMKRHPLAWRDTLEGRAIACLYGGPSTRSRVSIQVAAYRLGALPVMLRPEELQLGRGERVSDTARVLSSYCDAIVTRDVRDRDVRELADYASVPVIDAHACQALADCLTLRAHFRELRGLPVAYVGGCARAAHTLIDAAWLTGIELRLAVPPGGLADPVFIARAGHSLRLVEDPREAVEGARAVYTDTWPESHEGFRVTAELMDLAAPRAVFMHPLPARRREEVDTDVIDGAASIVWEQAANLLPVEQAVLRAAVTGDWEV